VIGFLHGTLAASEPPVLVIDVHGVGYEVEAPLSTCFALPAVGKTVHLHTHLVVREDQHILFGFATESERRLFRSLIKVSGVGARTALAILSGMSAETFIRCIETEDTAALVRLPGVGRKTAERLIVELRDRLGQSTPGGLAAPVPGAVADPRSEALNALVALGYKPPEARRLLERVPDEGQATEALLRTALRQAGARS
jgi:Holliday junction DNA helicase RuvA